MKPGKLAAVGLLGLAGCVSPAQREQADISYTQGLAAQCESLGYTRQTDQWRQCIIQLHTANQQQPQPHNYRYRAPSPRQPVQTNCYRDAAGNVSCTTY